MKDSVERRVAAYREQLPHLNVFARTVADLIATVAERAGIELRSLRHRVKSIDSFQGKLIRLAEGGRPNDEIRDTVGVRVECYFQEDVRALANAAGEFFEIHETVLPRLGSANVHLFVAIPNATAKVLGLPKFEGFRAECQLRTVTHQALDEITHRLGYRIGFIPANLGQKLGHFAAAYEDTISEIRRTITSRNISPTVHSTDRHRTQTPKRTARELANEFKHLLGRARNENDIQNFLRDHPQLIYPDMVQVWPKLKLGDDMVTDFVLRVQGAEGAEYVFVEIERSSKPIFVAKGQFSAPFTQAKDQLLNWERWIDRNAAYLREKLPDLHKPQFHLIMGRSAKLTQQGRDKLATEFRGTLRRFSTYDDLLDRFETITGRLFGGA